MTDVPNDFALDGDDLTHAGRERDGPHRARPSRIPVQALVTLNGDGGCVEAIARDVSQDGLKIELNKPLASAPISVKLAGFPIFSCEVRWHDARHIGVRFLRPVPWDFLKTWVKTHGSRNRG